MSATISLKTMKFRSGTLFFLLSLLCGRVRAIEDNTHGGLRNSPRRTQSTCSTTSVEVSFFMEASLLSSVQEAATLVEAGKGLFRDRIMEEFPEIIGIWRDIDDQVMLAKHNDQCFLVFTPRLFDDIDNINPFTQQVGDCRVRAGYARGYNMSKADEFHPELQTCLNSCGGAICGLVTTGYSQGGADSIVAAIDLARYSPITITFGTTGAIIDPSSQSGRGQPCTDFIPENHYQFVTFLDGQYDSIPMGGSSFFSTTHAGRLLLLDGTTENFVASPQVLQVGESNSRSPTTSRAHEMSLYKEGIDKLMTSGCNQVPVGKWDLGHLCNYNDECDSGTCHWQEGEATCT